MFHIVCLIKFTPDIRNFKYDYEKNVLVRENVDLVLNPDDACAIAFALKLKDMIPDVHVRLVCMGPVSIMDHIRDLLRRNVDEATLLIDKKFAGSDTFVTSSILGSFLETVDYNLILTGTHTLDGDTAHVPSQVADSLSLPQMTGITGFDLDKCKNSQMVCNVRQEDSVYKYKVLLPALLGISSESKMKLPFVSYNNLDKYVDDRITVLSNSDLHLAEERLGLKGSPTKVVRTHTKELAKRAQIVVRTDAEGIETVYQFFKDRGFIKHDKSSY